MASTKRKRPPSRDVDDDDNDEWDIKNWTSRHYDDISENTTSAIEEDLFDRPSDNNNKRKKKYGGTIARNGDDDGGGSEMMDEDGMFLSLEVLPANTYVVERTGDEVVGYVTKVIYKTGRGQRGEDDNAAADTITADNSCNNLDNNDDDNNDADMAKRKDKAKRKREKAKLKKMESRNNNKDDGGGEEEKKATKIAAIKSTSKEISDGKTSSSSGRVQDYESINTTMTKKESRRMKREAKKLLLVKLQDKGRRQQQHDGDHTQRTRRQKTNNESGTPSTKNLRQNHNNDDDIIDDGVNDEVEQLRTSWSIAAPGISLHPILSKGLHRLSYAHPTPIQCATLPPAILGRRDIVGAAPTGSGKTLSYGLPILQRLLDERDEYNEQEEQQLCTMKEVDENHTNNKTTNINGNIDSNRVLRALILVPTRELAIQVEAELLTVCLKSIGIRTIVGGFAEAKQRRVLEKERPAIVVATPGRLWELVRVLYLSLSVLYASFSFFLGSRVKKELGGREERRMHQ